MPGYAPRRTHLMIVRETAPEWGDDEVDRLDELGDEIATLAAHIHAATQRLLTLIAEFDQRRGWELGGHRSCAHWLALRTGSDMGAAREKVRAARALTALPETSASMARGELSFSTVRALTRVATPENEADLLELARGCTTAQVERMVRGWKRGTRMEDAEWERVHHESRCLSVFPDGDGMYIIKGRLPAEIGVLLMRAIEASSDELYREHRASQGGDHRANPLPTASETDTVQEAAQRRADAIGLMAERALAAGFGAGAAPLSGSRAERYQVMLHVDPATLASDRPASDTLSSKEIEAGGSGRSNFEDGTRVSAETSRRLSCDAGVVRIERARNGSVLNVGRRTRTIPPALRRALNARDQGCRFPGCGLRFTDAHHVRHWADGGETSLGNCLLLCKHHHRLVHEGGWTVQWWGDGYPAFLDPRGWTHFDGGWKPPELPARPVEALIEQNRLSGAAPPDGWTAGVRWKREADIPDEVYFRALEAMG
jgi:Domain of unknown function (DUF222)/HNH endonuclease